jgi:hypothetical protein
MSSYVCSRWIMDILTNTVAPAKGSYWSILITWPSNPGHFYSPVQCTDNVIVTVQSNIKAVEYSRHFFLQALYIRRSRAIDVHSKRASFFSRPRKPISNKRKSYASRRSKQRHTLVQGLHASNVRSEEELHSW